MILVVGSRSRPVRARSFAVLVAVLVAVAVHVNLIAAVAVCVNWPAFVVSPNVV
jgi:hypothetical protein